MTNNAEQKNQLARINRKLAPKNTLKALRAQSGDYHLINTRENKILDTHLNLDVFEEAITLHGAETAPQSRRMDPSRHEALAMRFVQKLTVGVPDPLEFSKEELDIIAGWCGMVDKAIFMPGNGQPDSPGVN